MGHANIIPFVKQCASKKTLQDFVSVEAYGEYVDQRLKQLLALGKEAEYRAQLRDLAAECVLNLVEWILKDQIDKSYAQAAIKDHVTFLLET